MKKIILASASPRRKELLAQLGLKFEVEPSSYPEEAHLKLKPHELAKTISREKARAVAARHHQAIVIAADTFALLGTKILGKPQTETEARRMLETINGKTHSVITGFTIMDTDSHKIRSQSVETKVHLRKLTPQQIDVYVKSGEPLGKAGAYAIQGLGATIVKKIEGDYSNVVGLPLCALTESLKEFGIKVPP